MLIALGAEGKHMETGERGVCSVRSDRRSCETWDAQDLPWLPHAQQVGPSSSRSPSEIAREISPVLITLNNLCKCYHVFIFYGRLAKP